MAPDSPTQGASVPTDAEISEAIQSVLDPELNRTIADLGMLKEVVQANGNVRIMIALTSPTSSSRHALDEEITDIVAGMDGVNAVQVDFTVFSPEEAKALRQRLHGDPAETAGSLSAMGHAEGRRVPMAHPSSGTRVLLIASGKGGVGKSSVTTNLAVTLAQQGHSVGVVDADVWGFSIPRMLGVTSDPAVIDTMLVPPVAHGVRCISMGFFAGEDQAVIWRGPMLHKALEQFLTDVFWDDPDFLLIDLPPGTGDVSLSISQYLPNSEVYVVTTPERVAQRVAQRAAAMAEKVNLEVKGVIENMSWFTGDDGKRYEIFGSGGGDELAEKVGAPLLGQIPLQPQMREGADAGTPIVVSEPDGEVAVAFRAIADRITGDLAPTRRYHAGLKLIAE